MLVWMPCQWGYRPTAGPGPLVGGDALALTLCKGAHPRRLANHRNDTGYLLPRTGSLLEEA